MRTMAHGIILVKYYIMLKGISLSKKTNIVSFPYMGVSRGVKFIEEREELYARNILPHFQNNKFHSFNDWTFIHQTRVIDKIEV